MLCNPASALPPPPPLPKDVDPGHDDAFALMLAGWDERIELLGVSSVAGNVPVECTTRNTLNTLWAAGLSHVPVFKGQDRPLVR